MSTLEVPRLRFPKFTGSWGKKSLGDIATFTKGAGISKEDITPSGKQKAIRYGELYTTYGETITEVKSKTNLESSQLVLSKANDVIIPASGETAIDIATASCVLDDGVALSGDINIVRSSNNGVFLAYYLNNAKKLDIARRAQGVSVIHLYKSGLQSLDLYLPSNEEQNTIASFLSLIDENIKAIERKIALSKRYKVGVLQKLFPRKGQTNPELRFKNDDGSRFPDWQAIPLSNFLMQKIRAIDTPSKKYLGLGVRSHFKGLMQRQNSEPDKIMMDTLYVVKEGDLVVNITFAWEGAVAIADSGDDGGLVSHRFPTYRFNEDVVLGEFFRYVFPGKKFKYDLGLASPGGAGRNRVLSKKEFLKIVVQAPSIEEQVKIANLLNGIDNEIEDQERKLEQAKRFKKALLQQMFV